MDYGLLTFKLLFGRKVANQLKYFQTLLIFSTPHTVKVLRALFSKH